MVRIQGSRLLYELSMITFDKKVKIGKAFLKSRIQKFPLWVHLDVTNRCNLSCSYCYAKDDDSKDPDGADVKNWITQSDDLGAILVAFLGGEPTLREDLPELIGHATRRSLISYLTSNGQHRNFEAVLVESARAGLDFIQVSLDGYDAGGGSKKTLKRNPGLIDLLESMKHEYGVKFKLHNVLTPSNLDETPKLVELAKNRRVPITFGLVNTDQYIRPSTKVVYSEEIKPRLKQTLTMLIEAKAQGAPILNSQAYFDDAFGFLDGTYKWECDMGNTFLGVASDGTIYLCPVLSSTFGVKFLDIDKRYFKDDKHNREIHPGCQQYCLSACAYLTSSLIRNPVNFLADYRKSF